MPINPQVAIALSLRSVFETLLKNAPAYINLDPSGVAGFFFGEEALLPMATIYLYEHRKWMGWYNSPGSYELAKRCGGLAGSRAFESLFPSVRTGLTTLFRWDGIRGPQFRAVRSGTTIETGPFAALFMEACASLPSQEKLTGRMAQPAVGLTIANLHYSSESSFPPAPFDSFATIPHVVPIYCSVLTCVLSYVAGDRLASTLILLGILANGFSRLVIGSGKLIITSPEAGSADSPNDGILISEKGIVVLLGDRRAISAVIHGRFSLQFKSEPHYLDIRTCCLLFMVQSIAQLFLIPQATLFGQLMFVSSLSISWAYNLWLSSFDKVAIWTGIVRDHIKRYPKLIKYGFGTHASVAVFALLMLKPDPKQADGMLDILLPTTKVYAIFKKVIIRGIRSENGFKISVRRSELSRLVLDEERVLLSELLYDAEDAYSAFRRYHDQ